MQLAGVEGARCADGTLDVLVPTVDRPDALAVTLGGLLAQDVRARLVVADQTFGASVADDPAVAAVLRLLRWRGWRVEVHHRRGPLLGVAEQRQFLLDRATAEHALFLDDDVLLEPWALARLLEAAEVLGCGFVGMGLAAPSHLADVRPHEHVALDLWDGEVRPERVRKGTRAWERWRLHNAANVQHLTARLPDGVLPARGWVAYKVAWVGGCVLYRTAALRAVGGYGFWRDLPPNLRGEDVVAQLLVMEQDGGAGLLPSGAWHLELPTTLVDRSVDAYAEVLERDAVAVR
ncbi:glycosyltransferase family A protein [Microlunatus spumicola]|uniref:Glycosyltransferase family A protein n=1 Tax=Microlunatus spumicola TaxID=81499 RepID=A0ABP6XVM9_9ACTN